MTQRTEWPNTLTDNLAIQRAREMLGHELTERVLLDVAQVIKDNVVLLLLLKRAAFYVAKETPHSAALLHEIESATRKVSSRPHAETSANPTL